MNYSYIIYGIIVVIIIFVVYGALSRRKIYAEVDRIEAWKIKILNKPVTEEISKVKGLIMSGETEEKFEQWRNDWDHVVGNVLPDIEEGLFDAEEHANKYRFKKAKVILQQLRQDLTDIETQLELMMEDIQLLITSEEQNRSEISDTKEQFIDVKRYFTIHRSSFGQATDILQERVEKLEESLEAFDEATKQGNYINARQILQDTKVELEFVHKMLVEIPKYLEELTQTIPTDIEEVRNGIIEMEQSGYPLGEFSFEAQVEELTEKCQEQLVKIQQLQLEEITKEVEEINTTIESIYEKMEAEVQAKQQVETKLTTIGQLVLETKEKLTIHDEELAVVKQSYRIEAEEAKTHAQLSERLGNVMTSIETVDETVEQKPFSVLLQQLMETEQQLLQLNGSIDESQLHLTTLRKDELKAKQALKELKHKILEGKRVIQKSNVPGLPLQLLEELQTSEKNLYAALLKVEEIPIEMHVVNVKVAEVTEQISHLDEMVKETINNAYLAERIIQYGNRYRSKSEAFEQQLAEAEDAFRSYYYEEAIEIAKEAIMQYEPNVMDKVQHFLNEDEKILIQS
ncbi:septation ring formation regulator EzrA [Alkalihalobacillus sp. LMS39]|uniref:septation ring formation regulator EzrA n=1 Tax=Alkalihalobacillus sp. LMS39 TaxID=2924032 RepID=UPI001FB41335|nr:septation ring formation regulator EzrA [Alkalihalobacillus sp. LMS39]UOE93457.1 septation ring formation regulator EzrA [Alkalihalobacillus sp. LMS39]